MAETPAGSCQELTPVDLLHLVPPSYRTALHAFQRARTVFWGDVHLFQKTVEGRWVCVGHGESNQPVDTVNLLLQI